VHLWTIFVFMNNHFS